MKKILKRTVLSVSILLGSWLSSSAYACDAHDHLCTYHALGVPRTSYDVNNDETRLVIYAKATDTSHGNDQTDFDNHVLLPTSSISHDWLGTATPVDVRPFVVSLTSFGRANPSDVREWETSDTKGAHVYSSQYQVIFNKNTAQAIHTGDLNGGEKGNTPYQQGCPAYEGKPNCEAVVITGNVPSGTYQQQVQMFNFFNKDNPSAVLTVGAWTTGQGVLVSDTHLDSNTQSMLENNRRLHDSISQGTTEQTHYAYLEGSKSKLPQPINYKFYNRGFNPHAQGVVVWDFNKRNHVRYGNQFSQLSESTGAIDVYQNRYTRTSFQRTVVGADGHSNTNTHWTPERKNTQKLGTQYCSDGRASVRCDVSGAVVATNLDGSFTSEFMKLQEDIAKQDREKQKKWEEEEKTYTLTVTHWKDSDSLIDKILGLGTPLPVEDYTEVVTVKGKKEFNQLLAQEREKYEKIDAQINTVVGNATQIYEILSDLPFTGEAINLGKAIDGKDPITGEELSAVERVVSAVESIPSIGRGGKVINFATGNNQKDTAIESFFVKAPKVNTKLDFPKFGKDYYVDPRTNQLVEWLKKNETKWRETKDHIVSQDWIKNNIFFKYNFTKDQQKWLLNLDFNLEWLPQTINSSKGNKDAQNLNMYLGENVSQEYKDTLQSKQEINKGRLNTIAETMNELDKFKNEMEGDKKTSQDTKITETKKKCIKIGKTPICL